MNKMIKQSFLYSISVLLVLLIHGNREKEDYGYLKATITGPNGAREWKATEMFPDKYVSEILQIAGANGNSALWVQIENPEQGKRRELVQTDLNHFVDQQHNMYMVQNGTITVTKMNDQWVEGNFSFHASDKRRNKAIDAREGIFKVPNPKRFKK